MCMTVIYTYFLRNAISPGRFVTKRLLLWDPLFFWNARYTS